MMILKINVTQLLRYLMESFSANVGLDVFNARYC